MKPTQHEHSPKVNANKIYIVVRVTEDFEMNEVNVFQSVHSTLEKAEAAKNEMEEFLGGGMELDVIERELDSSWMSVN